MSSPGAPIRRCPECGEEFLPHIVHCSDCGALLESAFEGDDRPREPQVDPTAADPGSDGLVTLLIGLTPGTADQAAQALAAAGLPFRLAADPRRGIRVGVAEDQMAAALAILARDGIVPEQPDASQGPVAAEGGPCPACGDHVAPGTIECPGCGLQLAGTVECRHCGAELEPTLDGCPRCAREQD